MTVGLNSSAPCRSKAVSSGEGGFSRPVSTIVIGTALTAGCECRISQRKKVSSERWKRGSRRNKTPSNSTTIITQIDGRSIEQE